MSLVTAHSGGMFFVDTTNGDSIYSNDSRIDWFIRKDVQNASSKFSCNFATVGDPYFIIGRTKAGSTNQLFGVGEYFLAVEIAAGVGTSGHNTDIINFQGVSGLIFYMSGDLGDVRCVLDATISLPTVGSYQIRWKQATSGANGILQVYVDGVQKINMWHSVTGDLGQIQFGSNPAFAKDTGSFGSCTFANIWINDTAGSVNNTWPTSITADTPLVATQLTTDGENGTYNQWSSSVGGNKWLDVDETPPSSAGDNIFEATQNEEEALTLTTTANTPRAVTWHWYYWGGTETGVFGRIVNGTRYYGATTITASATGDNVIQCDEFSPDTGVAYTGTEIGAMEILQKRTSASSATALRVGACRATVWSGTAGPAASEPPPTGVRRRFAGTVI